MNNTSALKLVDLPPSIRILNDNAFRQCENLLTVSLNDNIVKIGESALGLSSSSYGAGKRMKVTLSALPENLINLGAYAFLGNETNLSISSLPLKLTTIPNFCFAWCKNVAISIFGGEMGVSPLTYIGSHAMYGTGGGIPEIEIGPSVMTIGENAFGSSYTNLVKVSFGRSEYIDTSGNSITPTKMGFDESKITIEWPI